VSGVTLHICNAAQYLNVSGAVTHLVQTVFPIHAAEEDGDFGLAENDFDTPSTAEGMGLLMAALEAMAENNISFPHLVTVEQDADESETPVREPAERRRLSGEKRSSGTSVGEFSQSVVGIRMKKRKCGKRVGSDTPVYLAAVLEYMTAELLELAGNACRDNKKWSIDPGHLQLAIRNDDELNRLLWHVPFSEDVLPPITRRALAEDEAGQGRASRVLSSVKFRDEKWTVYIYRVLKRLYRDIGISSQTLTIMNYIINDLFHKFCVEASARIRMDERATISVADLKTAIRLTLPGELAKHAIIFGDNAVTKL
jgi:histone H3/H4